MKALLLALVFFTGALTFGQALEIVTPAQTFRDVTVSRVEAEGVRIFHSEGAAVVDFDDLPAAMQLQYGWTPEKSAARKAVRAAKAAEEKRIEDEKRMIAEEPKRKAEEAAAKERAIKAKEEAEAAARAKVEAIEAQKDLLAAAAQARAEIDRERGKGVRMINGIPVAELMDAPEKSDGQLSAGIPSPGKVAAPSVGKPSFWSRNLAIGFGVAGVIVLVLFCLASSRNKIRVVTPAHEEEP